MGEDGGRWQAVDPQDRSGTCAHERLHRPADVDETVCLLCGASVQPVLAEVTDLDAARRRRRRR